MEFVSRQTKAQNLWTVALRDELGRRVSTGAKTGVSALWPWPDSLDAVRAAREYHRVLLENEFVRVLEVRIKPGQIVPVHTHRWPAAVFVLSASDFVRRDEKGNMLFDSRTAGAPPAVSVAQWTGPLPPHSVENIGSAEIHLITTEVKEQS